MVILELKMVPGEAEAATMFLQSKIPGGIKVNGNKIEIEDEKGGDVKLLLHKFLDSERLAVTGFSAIPEPSRSFRMTNQLGKNPKRMIRSRGYRPFLPYRPRDSR
jgi:hypothetical protein